MTIHILLDIGMSYTVGKLLISALMIWKEGMRPHWKCALIGEFMVYKPDKLFCLVVWLKKQYFPLNFNSLGWDSIMEKSHFILELDSFLLHYSNQAWEKRRPFWKGLSRMMKDSTLMKDFSKLCLFLWNYGHLLIEFHQCLSSHYPLRDFWNGFNG